MSDDDVLAALREQGAHRHDPVRWRFLEALAARMQGHPAAVRAELARRFDVAVADYRLRAAGEGVCPQKATPSASSGALRSPLAQLNCYIAEQATEATGMGDAMRAVNDQTAHGVIREMASPSDMRSVRRFADTWSRIATQQQLSKALERGPAHAGPLNSHNLMLRAMSLMNGLSPDYLRRFMAQAEAWMWLDQLNQSHALKGGKTAARRGRTKLQA
jgi:hypothetical protein